MNKILQELQDRGMVSNLSDEKKLDACVANKKAVYVGFDPSHFSLHLGNFVLVRVLQIFEKNNIKIFPLIGGATGQIGDPSGKKSERILLEKNIIDNNILAISKQLKKFIKGTEILNNFDFYENMSLFDFLKNVGKDFNIGYLIAKETIKNRIETGISYTEFSYNIIQAYDWYCLNENYNIGIQCGGSDQWGNITSGLEYIRKKKGTEELVAGITINLLTKSDGTKFGKSEKGAVFLDKNLTSVFEMYQFLFNQNDADIEKLLNFLTTFEVDEIREIISEHVKQPSKRLAQKKLCKNIITKIHGNEEWTKVKRLTNLFFQGKYADLSIDEFEDAFNSNPKIKICKFPNKLIDIIIEAKITNSKRLARELFENQSFTLNGKIIDSEFIVEKTNLLHEKYLIIKKGKRNFYVIEV